MWRRTLGLAVVAVLALLAARYWQGSRARPRPVVDIDPTQVVALEVTTAESGGWALARRDGEWWLERPVIAAAEPTAVQTLLEVLCRIAPEADLVGDRGELGLDPPRAVLTLTTNAGPTQLHLGDAVPGQPVVAAERPDRSAVVGVNAQVAELVSLPADRLRLRRPLVRLLPMLDSLSIERADGVSYRLERRPDGWWVDTGGGVVDMAGGELLRDLWRVLAEFEVVQWSLPSAGPGGLARLVFRAGEERLELVVMGAARPGQAAGAPVPLRLDGEAVMAQTQLPAGLPRQPRALALAGGRPVSAVEVELEVGTNEGRFRFDDQAGWRERSGGSVDSESVGRAVDWLRGFECVAFVAPAAAVNFGLAGEPVASAVIVDRLGERHRFELLAGRGKWGAVRYDHRPELLALERLRFEELFEALRIAVSGGS